MPTNLDRHHLYNAIRNEACREVMTCSRHGTVDTGHRCNEYDGERTPSYGTTKSTGKRKVRQATAIAAALEIMHAYNACPVVTIDQANEAFQQVGRILEEVR